MRSSRGRPNRDEEGGAALRTAETCTEREDLWALMAPPLPGVPGISGGLSNLATLSDVASRNFTVVGEAETAFDVIRRMWRRNAIMAVVVRRHGIPRAEDVAGVITKEHVADSVADSVSAYPQSARSARSERSST
jgi:hypothetical protein